MTTSIYPSPDTQVIHPSDPVLPSASFTQEEKKHTPPIQLAGRKVCLIENLPESKERSSFKLLEAPQDQPSRNRSGSTTSSSSPKLSPASDSSSHKQKSPHLSVKNEEKTSAPISHSASIRPSSARQKRLSLSSANLDSISSSLLKTSHIETNSSPKKQKELLPEQKPHLSPHLSPKSPEPLQKRKGNIVESKDTSSQFILHSLKTLFRQKEKEKILDFLRSYENLNKIHKVFFNYILFQLRLSHHPIENLSLNENISLLIEILTTHLKTMENPSILLYREMLEEIGQYNEELKLLISSHIQEAQASELILFFLQQTTHDQRQATLFCHPRFVTTDHFIRSLFQHALDHENQRTILLQAVLELMNHSSFYPIPVPRMFNLYQLFQHLPQQGELNGIKEKLLSATWSIIKQPSSPIALPPPLETFSEALKKTLGQTKSVSFDKIVTAIHENKVSKSMVHDLAWDLKKIDSSYLNLILPKDLVAYIKKIQGESVSPVVAYIQHTNRLSYFVLSTILNSEHVKVRANWCEFYIKLMQQSIAIGNLQTAFTLLSALNNASLIRLKLTWKELSASTLTTMNKIQELFCSEKNFKNYWNYQEKWEVEHKKVSAENCLIPFFGLFLQALTFIEDGNSTYLTHGHLNLTKIMLLAHQYTLLQKYQKHLLTFKDSLLNNQYKYNIAYCIKQQANEIKQENQEINFDEAFEALHKCSLTVEPSLLPPGS